MTWRVKHNLRMQGQGQVPNMTLNAIIIQPFVLICSFVLTCASIACRGQGCEAEVGLRQNYAVPSICANVS